ncbi:hypothetical protein [Thiolapillus sp.]
MSRNPSIILSYPSFFRETPVRDPTMIMAVTLFNTAENNTVMLP